MEHNIKELIKEVLEKGYLMSLATLDDKGIWVADLIYVFDDDFSIYWISDLNTRHSRAIIENKEVAGTITAQDKADDELGLQFEGIAEKIKGQRFDLAVLHYIKRGKKAPKETDDILEGEFWYVLKPKRIELINGKLFGHSRKSLTL